MFKIAERCGLCNSKIRQGSGIMKYRATDDEGVHHMYEMQVCKECCDDMDAEHQQEDKSAVREWLLRK